MSDHKQRCAVVGSSRSFDNNESKHKNKWHGDDGPTKGCKSKLNEVPLERGFGKISLDLFTDRQNSANCTTNPRHLLTSAPEKRIPRCIEIGKEVIPQTSKSNTASAEKEVISQITKISTASAERRRKTRQWKLLGDAATMNKCIKVFKVISGI